MKLRRKKMKKKKMEEARVTLKLIRSMRKDLTATMLETAMTYQIN